MTRHKRPIRVGFEICTVESSFGDADPTWRDLMDMGQRAEALGFDSLWVADHLLHAEQDLMAHFDAADQELYSDLPAYGWWDAFTILTALACATSRVTLGPLVACTQFRNPALTAKVAETLDEISDGRLVLGLGAGDAIGEMAAFGMPSSQLVGRFEEATTIITSMLRNGESDFQGKFYETHACELRLRGPRPAGPPIMISAKGPRMLRIAAEKADLWNGFLGFSGTDTKVIESMLQAVDAACEAVSRDPVSLPRTLGLVATLPGSSVPGYTTLNGSPEAMAERFLAMAALGVEEVIVWLHPFTPDGLNEFARVLEILDQ